MYFLSSHDVNAVIVGFGERWLLFVATATGLRLTGHFQSADAARAALGVR